MSRLHGPRNVLLRDGDEQSSGPVGAVLRHEFRTLVGRVWYRRPGRGELG